MKKEEIEKLKVTIESTRIEIFTKVENVKIEMTNELSSIIETVKEYIFGVQSEIDNKISQIKEHTEKNTNDALCTLRERVTALEDCVKSTSSSIESLKRKIEHIQMIK